MKLKLVRFFKGENYTIGKLYLDEKYFCDTLEDKVRIKNCNCEDKIYGKTAVPEGEYTIELIHRASNNILTPLLLDVPCFTSILIHAGNTQFDTEGCILVGQNKVKGKVINSKVTFENLIRILKEEENKLIEIV